MEKAYSKINETVNSFVCDSGLPVYVIPKKGFDKTYAMFAANFGSVDCHFSADGNDIKIPNGVAHFLEHKMFEQPDGKDAFAVFSKYGAQANAFTSFDMTAYLFSTSNNFDNCLEHLLSFVSTPHFTNENVAKEQGIIAQEIKMYDDEPSWTVFFNMLRALYENHPINIDIAGSVQSISQITPEILYKCYNAYYNPENMLLCVVGNVNPDDVFVIAQRVISRSDYSAGKTIMPTEKETVNKTYIEKKMAVSLPMFTVGFKEKPVEDKLYYDAVYSVLLNAAFGKSTPFYSEVYNKGLITSLSSSYNYGKEYAFIEITGESPNPKELYEKILKYTKEIKNRGLDKNLVEISKKSLYGKYIKGLNSLDGIAHGFVSSSFLGEDYFTYGDKLLSVTKEAVDEVLKSGFNESTLSAVFGGNEK